MRLINGCQVSGVGCQRKAKILFCLLLAALFALSTQGQAQAALEGPDSGLVGWWKFDEGSGTTAADSSGNNNNGTLQNFSTDNSMWIPGQIGQALTFNAVNSIVVTPSDFVGANPATICVWTDAKSLGVEWGYSRIIENGRLILQVNKYAQYSFTSDNGAHWVYTANNLPILNRWCHVCLTRDASGLVNFYVDGVLSGAANQNSGTPVAGVRQISIGGKTTTPYQVWDGYLDDLRMYNRVLSASEISELYYQGKGNPEASTPPPDTTPPLISSLTVSNILTDSVLMSWVTDEAADTQVEYGPDSGYGFATTLNRALSLSHMQFVSGLSVATTYHYCVKSKNTSGNLRVSADSVFTTSAPAEIPGARYILGSGPFIVEDLGSPIQSAAQERQNMFRMQNGQTHLILYYVANAYVQNPFQILDLNLEEGTYALADGALGRPGVNATVFHPNGKMYHASGAASVPASAFEYDPQTATVRQLGQLSDQHAEVAEIGDDNAVYFGTCCHGKATRYDPATDTLEDLGRMDENPQDDYETNYQYGYTIGADTRYVYVGLGENPWYLGIYDRQTRQKTIYWRDDQDTGGIVCHGKLGGWYYQRSNPSIGNKWYKLENGIPTEIPASQAPQVYYHWQYGGNVGRDFTKFPDQFGYEIDLGNATPDSGSGSRAIIKWRKTGAADWQSVSVSGIRLDPAQIKRVYDFGNNKLLGTIGFYGPTFQYDMSTKEAVTLGLPQYNLYDALFYDNNNIFFAGYPAAVIRYDPTKSWTLTSSTVDKFSPSVNPYNINTAFGKYDFYLVKGGDGLVYIGGHHERNSTGGELGWYNPITNEKGSLRDPLLEYDVVDLISVEGGRKIVFSGKSIETGLDGKLFVVDVSTKQIVNIITPWPGATAPAPGKIVEVEPGVILGVITQTNATYIYKLNINTDEVICTNIYPETAFGIRPSQDNRIIKAPDGYVWLQVGNNISRINPNDGAVERVILNQTGNPLFVNGTDLYIYGSNNLLRIKNILVETVRYGDVSGDGIISAYDAALTARYAVDIIDTDFKNAQAADVDGNGSVTAYDAALIAQKAIGLIDKFPVEN